MSHLLRQSEELVLEGRELLKSLKLEEVLSQYGKVTIDGSLSYELMVLPDIDIGVWCQAPSIAAAQQVADYLKSQSNVQHVDVADTLSTPSAIPHHPDGIYLGIKALSRARTWNIDVWFLQPGREARLPDLAEDWYKHLSRHQKETILSLKQALVEAGEYGTSMQSPTALNGVDVYRGVVLGGVDSVGELRDWLAKSS